MEKGGLGKREDERRTQVGYGTTRVNAVENHKCYDCNAYIKRLSASGSSGCPNCWVDEVSEKELLNDELMTRLTPAGYTNDLDPRA